MSNVVRMLRLPSQHRLLVFRVGLVLGGLMAVFNTINGIGTLIDPSFGQTDPTVDPQPVWISVTLATFGIVTLAAWFPAWQGVREAILVVVGSRFLEAWSGIGLLFLPGSRPAGLVLFVIVLIIVGTAISYMVAQGLKRPATPHEVMTAELGGVPGDH